MLVKMHCMYIYTKEILLLQVVSIIQYMAVIFGEFVIYLYSLYMYTQIARFLTAVFDGSLWNFFGPLL